MKPEEVTRLVWSEIDHYRYEPPESGLYGKPPAAEKVAGSIGELKRLLLTPTRVEIRPIGDCWLIADAGDGYAVFYDEDAGEFGLATHAGAEAFQTVDVTGDLVGVFMAR